MLNYIYIQGDWQAKRICVTNPNVNTKSILGKY